MARAKRRIKRAIKPIARERHAVLEARTQASGVLRHFFSVEGVRVARVVAHAVARAVDMPIGKDAGDQSDAPDPQEIADEVLAELELDWTDLGDALEPIVLRIAQDGIAVAFDQIGLVPGADLLAQVNDAAVAWAKDRAAELIGMQVSADGSLVPNPNAEWAITDSTRGMLRTDIVGAIEDGSSSEDLASAIADDYAFSDARAETIARTELAMADVAGNLMAWRDSGQVSGKEWLLGSEHQEMDECDDAAAMGVVALDDDFGGLGDPPAHPNCACDVSPVLAEEDG